MEEFIAGLEKFFGVGEDPLTLVPILLRCIVIYVLGILLVRIGKKRFLGRITAFDYILAIIIGSLLSRAITRSELFFPIMAACILLILMHNLFSWLAASSDWFGNVIKGNERVLVRNGEILWKELKKSNLSEQDLLQSLRLNGRTGDVEQVKVARLERNGDISVVLKS